MGYDVEKVVKEYQGLGEHLESDPDEDAKEPRLGIRFNVTPEEARKAKTTLGRNYNGGTLPNPYMSKENWKGWFVIGVIVAFLIVLIS